MKQDSCASCCEKGWKVPRRTVKPNGSWIIHSKDASVPKDVPVQETTESLEGTKEQAPRRRVGQYLQDVSKSLKGEITIDSGACDSVLPKDELRGLFPMLPKKDHTL